LRDLSAEPRIKVRGQAEARQKPQRRKAAKKSQIITLRLGVFAFYLCLLRHKFSHCRRFERRQSLRASVSPREIF